MTAVEINPRFLETGDSHNTDILKADMRETDFERNRFDLIHSRYVLLHIPNYQSILAKLLESLKPGGWIVLEELDFSAASSGPWPGRRLPIRREDQPRYLSDVSEPRNRSCDRTQIACRPPGALRQNSQG